MSLLIQARVEVDEAANALTMKLPEYAYNYSKRSLINFTVFFR